MAFLSIILELKLREFSVYTPTRQWPRQICNFFDLVKLPKLAYLF